MKIPPESLVLIKFSILAAIILFLITSIRALLANDEKKAEVLRLKAVVLSFLSGLMMIIKFRFDIAVSIGCCLLTITIFIIYLNNEILKKIFVKWFAATFMLLSIMSLIYFRFS